MKTIWEILGEQFKDKKLSVEEFKKEVENRQRASTNFVKVTQATTKIKEKTVGINQVFIYAHELNTGKIYLGFDVQTSPTNYFGILYANDFFKADNLNAEIYAYPSIENDLVACSQW